MLTYLAGLKSGENEEDESTKTATIYEQLASANQEDLTSGKEKVENKMVRPTPREQKKWAESRLFAGGRRKRWVRQEITQ